MSEQLHEGYKKQYLIRKPILWGTIAGIALLAVYFLILTFANSFGHAFQQFSEMWYWIALLVVGFSLQVGLYAYIRSIAKIKVDMGATTSVATAGGISTTSMVACCAHHITDVFPILGVSAAAVFLNQFQTLFIIIGVLSNLIGINLMLKIIQEHKLYHKDSRILSVIIKYNMKKLLYFTSTVSAVIFLIVLFKSI